MGKINKEKDKEMQVTLLESEIQEIIRSLEDVPYGIFIFMNYHKIVKKLKEAKGKKC